MLNLIQTINQEKNSETEQLSELSLREVLNMINSNDAQVATAIGEKLDAVEMAVELIVKQIRLGGRLFYIGAGTSGRLGVLDSAECPPTFGTDPSLVQSIIAGGLDAMLAAVENVEDSVVEAPKALEARGLNERDIVVGIAASGRTPFVISGLEYAKKIGAKTIAITTRGRGEISDLVDLSIDPDVGSEVLAGSTRMKSGTAQKMMLGMISTAVMIQLGKVHGNLMVDVKASNEKLRKRAENMVSSICEIDAKAAERLIKQTQYNVRAAVLMHSLSISAEEALAIASNPFQSLKQQLCPQEK